MEDIHNKVVLITGASSGIGEALAREFSKRGARLVLCARRRERLDNLAKELGNAIVAECDVTHDGDVEKAVAQAHAAFGPIDMVVANAGFGVTGPFLYLTLADYQRQFETNVFGVLRTIYATVSDLQATQGRIAITGSVMGFISGPQASAYAMSKHAIKALAETLSVELQGLGISVTHLAPGFIATEASRAPRNTGVEPNIPPWLIMPAPVAAKQMASAIIRRKREAIITLHGRLFIWIGRHWSGVVAGILSLGVRFKLVPTYRPSSTTGG